MRWPTDLVAFVHARQQDQQSNHRCIAALDPAPNAACSEQSTSIGPAAQADEKYQAGEQGRSIPVRRVRHR
jgi:hypothetical protein